MNGITPETAGLMLLSAAEVPNFLAGLLPSKLTIKRFAADERDVRSLREGEVVGAALSVMVGAGASIVAKSWLPMAATLGVLGVLLWQYEQAIRNPHPDSKPIDQQANTSFSTGTITPNPDSGSSQQIRGAAPLTHAQGAGSYASMLGL